MIWRVWEKSGTFVNFGSGFYTKRRSEWNWRGPIKLRPDDDMVGRRVACSIVPAATANMPRRVEVQSDESGHSFCSKHQKSGKDLSTFDSLFSCNCLQANKISTDVTAEFILFKSAAFYF